MQEDNSEEHDEARGAPKETEFKGERTRTVNNVELERGTRNHLICKGAGGVELLSDEISGGDVGDAEQLRQTAGVGPFPHAGASQEGPLYVPPRQILPRPRGAQMRRRGRQPQVPLGAYERQPPPPHHPGVERTRSRRS